LTELAFLCTVSAAGIAGLGLELKNKSLCLAFYTDCIIIVVDEEENWMIIECPYCESKVDGEVKGEHESYHPEQDPYPFKAVLLKCPVCNNALLGGSDLEQLVRTHLDGQT